MDGPRLCTTRLLDQNFGMGLSTEDIILPFYNSHGTNYFRPWKVHPESDKKEFGSIMDNAKDKFKITLDVQHFHANEIKVTVNGKEVIIEGKHGERQDDHGFISRHFVRRYSLPVGCCPETVTSTLSSDGVLHVMANKSLPKDIKDDEKIVPIRMSGPCPQQEEFKTANEIKKMINDTTLKSVTDKKLQHQIDNNKSKVTLKEDHCRLLKPEFLKETISGTEKLLSESRKETDELMKLMSSETSAEAKMGVTSEKLEEALGQCKTAMAELKDKIGATNMSASSEMSSLKSSMISETFESKETSSVSKSMNMSSSMKSASEKKSELISDVICAELREAAENL